MAMRVWCDTPGLDLDAATAPADVGGLTYAHDLPELTSPLSPLFSLPRRNVRLMPMSNAPHAVTSPGKSRTGTPRSNSPLRGELGWRSSWNGVPLVPVKTATPPHKTHHHNFGWTQSNEPSETFSPKSQRNYGIGSIYNESIRSTHAAIQRCPHLQPR